MSMADGSEAVSEEPGEGARIVREAQVQDKDLSRELPFLTLLANDEQPALGEPCKEFLATWGIMACCCFVAVVVTTIILFKHICCNTAQPASPRDTIKNYRAESRRGHRLLEGDSQRSMARNQSGGAAALAAAAAENCCCL